MITSGNELQIVFPVEFTSENAFSIAVAGVLENVVVKFGDGSSYTLCLIDIDHLEKEIAENEKRGRPFVGRPGLIVTTNISKWIATIAVQYMHNDGYFSHVMPLESASALSGRPELILPDSYYRDTERELTEARGFFEGGMVAFGESGRVPVNFIVPWRVRREIELDAMNGIPFYADPWLVVVSQISRDVLTSAVNQLAEDGFFNHLRSSKP